MWLKNEGIVVGYPIRMGRGSSEGDLNDVAIARECGVNRRTLFRWRKREEWEKEREKAREREEKERRAELEALSDRRLEARLTTLWKRAGRWR